MAAVEDSTLSDADLDVSAFQPATLENEAVLDFRVDIDDPHRLLATWAVATFKQHSFAYHPTQGTTEIFRDSENFQVFLESLLNCVTFDRLVSILTDVEVFQ